MKLPHKFIANLGGIMAKVSMRIYLKRLRQAFVKLMFHVMVVSVVCSVLSLVISYFIEPSYVYILRILGFALMLIGAASKLGGHSLNTDNSYKLLMSSSKTRSIIKYEHDTIISNNSFFITCLLSGALIFTYSIVLVEYIL